LTDVIDFVLEGLEKYLELERELGVRSIECDRSLLKKEAVAPSPVASSSVIPAPTVTTSPPPVVSPQKVYDFVFIHDKPLSTRAIEMMAKIIPAMGYTAETAPIIVAPPIPKARFYIILGRTALQKYMPNVRGEENHWFTSPKGKEILLVKSPEEIVRFQTVSPALDKIKRAMWFALKTVLQKVKL